MTSPSSPTLSRRSFVGLIAITTAGGVMTPAKLFAQGNSTSLLISDSDICVITPEVTEGPYYFDPQLVRRDITEGRPGVPVLARLQVVDGACQPIAGARVDIWHCGADGLYSNYAGQGDSRTTSTVGETFFRGTQLADDNGIVEFVTVYPGWYSGRTTHIHFKVFLDQTNVLTGQIFFPDALSEFIYTNVEAYGGRSHARDTYNSGDNIAQQATRASYAHIKEEDNMYVASLVIGVNRDATSSSIGSGFGGQRPGGSPPNRAAQPTGATAPSSDSLIPS